MWTKVFSVIASSSLPDGCSVTPEAPPVLSESGQLFEAQLRLKRRPATGEASSSSTTPASAGSTFGDDANISSST